MQDEGLDIALRMRRTARTFRGMPSQLARSMSVTLPLRGQDQASVATFARHIAAEFGLVASIDIVPPVVTVRYVRPAPSGDP